MGKSSSPPPPPDYAGAAAAQGAANKAAAISASQLNNPNVISPTGTQMWETFDQKAYDAAKAAATAAGAPAPDPMQFYTGAAPADRPLLTETLSPEQQALFEQQQKTQGLLGGLGQQGAEALQGVVGKAVDFSGAPPAPGNYGDLRNTVIDAMMARPTEDYNRAVDQKRSDLVAAGIPVGSKAYDDQMQLLQRGLNDAQNQAQISAGNMTSQAFGMDEQARQQAISEYLAQRQVPLNEISALLSGSQVQTPNMPGIAQNANMAPAPVFQATNALGNYNTDLYNAGVGSQNAMMSGLFGLGSAGLGAYGMMNAAPSMVMMSDRRLKWNIRRIGTHPLGIGWYEYDIFGQHEEGVMADEVETVRPEAVLTHVSGYKMVDYGRLQ